MKDTFDESLLSGLVTAELAAMEKDINARGPMRPLTLSMDELVFEEVPEHRALQRAHDAVEEAERAMRGARTRLAVLEMRLAPRVAPNYRPGYVHTDEELAALRARDTSHIGAAAAVPGADSPDDEGSSPHDAVDSHQ
jgi:hypothetical protein